MRAIWTRRGTELFKRAGREDISYTGEAKAAGSNNYTSSR